MKNDKHLELTYQLAISARERAYAPYSKFKVGAALKLKGVDTPIVGCNVENASYGGTICAERGAILSAVAQYGAVEVEYIVIVTDQERPAVPCAFCLQVLSELCRPELKIYLANLKSITEQTTLEKLLPRPFKEFSI